MSNTFKKSETLTKSFKTIKAKKFILIDASNLVVGRLSSYIASTLRGKFNPQYTPHAEMGDFVVVINSDKIKFTSNKMKSKTYYRHTGYPGGIKTRTPQEYISRDQSDQIIIKAVEGMLPAGPLGRRMLENLRVYRDENHNHSAQNPKLIDFASFNQKNSVNN